MDSPGTNLSLDARNVNLYQAAEYQPSPTHCRVYPPYDSGGIDYFSETNLPPTGLLSPRKHRELYDSSGLSFSDVTGSPSHFAQMIRSPVRNVRHVSPYQSPIRQQMSPYHSPIKPGFTKIEHSPLINVTMTDETDWSHSPGRQQARSELRFTPQKSSIRTILYPHSVETPTHHSPCKIVPSPTPPHIKPLVQGYREFSPCKLQPPHPTPPKLQPVENLEFLLQNLSEAEALSAVQPLLDENQNIVPESSVPTPVLSTSKITNFVSSPTSVLMSANEAFGLKPDITMTDVSHVENDVDVDVLIDDGDINITLSSWDEEPDDGNAEFPCTICAKTFRRRSALSFHQCLHTGDSNSNSPQSRPSSTGLDVVDGPKPGRKSKFSEIKPLIMPPPKRERSFLCEHCGERFPSISARAEHLNVCDKNCNTFPPNLLKYLGTADDGRLMCTVCRKVFNHKSTLKTHIRVHTGEKPCKCRFCGKYYRDHSTLSKHYRVHTNEKPYKCSECMRCFSQSGNMRRHMIHVHKIALPPDASTLRADDSPKKRGVT